MKKWISVNNDGVIKLISESYNVDYIKIDITEDEYQKILNGEYLYDNGLVINPDYVPIKFTSSEIMEQLNRREFGQKVIATFQVEFKVEELLQTDFKELQLTIARTKSLFEALNNGWLGMAIIIIKSTPVENLTNIITAEVLKNYRNIIHEYLNITLVENYND